MERNPVGWFEIYVNDMARARRFYEGTLGIVLEQLEMPEMEGPAIDMWAFPMEQTGYGAGGALVHMDGMAAGGGGTLVYFSCADCAVEAGRASQHGGSLIRAKFPIGAYGFIALVNDSEGNLIGLHSMQ